MTQLVFPMILAALGIYATFLVFVFQQVSDRFTPGIIHPFFKHLVRFPILVVLTLALLFGIEFIMLSDSPHFWIIHLSLLMYDLLYFAVLIVAISTLIWSVTSIINHLADGKKIVRLLKDVQDTKFQECILEVLWNAIHRSDKIITNASLNLLLTKNQNIQEEVWTWFLGNKSLFELDWLSKEFTSLLSGKGEQHPLSEQESEVLITVVRNSLDNQSLLFAQELIRDILDMLSKAEPWTESHASLLYQLGFAIWKKGDEGAPQTRVVDNAEQLKNIQADFIGYINNVRCHLIALRDKQSFCRFVLSISDLLVYDRDLEIIIKVEDLLYRDEDATINLIDERTIELLVCGLRMVRRFADPDGIDWLDDITIQFAVLFVEIGGSEEGLMHLLSNGGILKKEQLTKFTQQDIRTLPNRKGESYQVVVKTLKKTIQMERLLSKGRRFSFCIMHKFKR